MTDEKKSQAEAANDAGNSATKKTPKPPFVIGIGASAGGLDAMRALISNIPEDVDAAFLVAQHMSPKHRSLLTELLSRQTSIPVIEVTGGEHIKSNRIYICPSNADITLHDEIIRLTDPEGSMGPKPSIDRLFSSLAEERGERCAGIILSGTGSDGTHGSRAIRASGGLTIAQEPSTAQYDAMPNSAISLGGAELVLSPEQIGRKIPKLIRSSRSEILKLADTSNASSRGPFDDILRAILEVKHLDFSQYKTSTLCRQIDRRVAALQLKDLPNYRDFILEHPEEVDALSKSFMISVTGFFRDTEPYEVIEKIMHQLATNKDEDEPLRIWIPGCATGEEVYSLAILAYEALNGMVDRNRVQIFGTDIDEAALLHARKGLYSQAAVDNLSPERLAKHFMATGNGYQVKEQLRELTAFATQDLGSDPPFLRIDLISCRNVLIYFKPELQEYLFGVFHYSLVNGGYLFLGNSEALNTGSDLFNQVGNTRVFQRNDMAHTPSLRLNSLKRPLDAPKKPKAYNLPGRSKNAREATKDHMRDALIAEFVPPSVLVDENDQILELSGSTENLFQMRSGSADFHVLKLIHPALRSELRSLLFRFRQSSHQAQESKHPVAIDDDKAYVVRASMLPGDSEKKLCLVSFQVVTKDDKAAANNGAEVTAGDPANPFDPEAEKLIIALQDEIAGTREHLQTVIEELETANEELQSMNEEMQASSEELQASNEELATSNEELQATNEELSTVNDELSQKTMELGAAYSDLENIQDATATALVVVDHNLLVRRFNASAVRILGLTRADIGRNFASLPIRLNIAHLLDTLKRALRGAQQDPIELHNGNYTYSVQMRPYQDVQNVIKGAVISFSDVTEFQLQENALQEANKLFSIFANHSRAVVWVQEPNFGKLIYINQAVQDLYGLDQKLALRDPAYLFKVMSEKDALAMKDMHIKHTKTPWRLHTQITHPENGEQRWLLTRGFPVRHNGKLQYITGFTIDDTMDFESKLSVEESSKLVSLLLGTSLEPTFAVDQQGNVLVANSQALALLGKEMEDVVGKSASQFLADNEFSTLQGMLGSDHNETQTLVRNNDPKVAEVSLASSKLLQADDMAGVIVLRQNPNTSDLDRRSALQASAFEVTHEGVMILDKETRILTVNPALLSLLQREETSLIGEFVDLFPESPDNNSFNEDMRRSLAKEGVWLGEVPFEVEGQNALTFEAEVRTLVNQSKDTAAAYTIMLRNVTERQSYEKTIYRQANFDPLTGLPNRTLLLDRLNQEISRAARDKASLTVMFLDLDHFKEINDTMGHEAGDKLLEQVAQRINDSIDDSDTCSRFGGDEFVLLLPQFNETQTPEVFARRLLEKIEHPFMIEDQELFVSASIGIAMYPHDGADASRLLANADAAMHDVKKSGRRGYAYHNKSMNKDASQRLAMERELRLAIDSGQILTYFQPVIDANTHKVVGCEALARWQHPELGLLPPTDFIPYAEKTGLIREITEITITNTLKHLAGWRTTFNADFNASVNLSPRLLMHEGVETILKFDNFKDLETLEGLTFEVTESLFMSSSSIALEGLKWLRERGARISLDDFGTGYSALNYLRRFPIDEIKIDRSFVEDAAKNEKDRALIRATVELGRGVGADLIAEGIETKVQQKLLLSLGVERQQGYLYARPMPAQQFDKYLVSKAGLPQGNDDE